MTDILTPLNPLTEKFMAKVAAAFVLTAGRAVIAWGWNDARRRQLAASPDCYVCGYRPPRGSNDVHHIIPRHVAPDLVGVASNLVTLCRRNNCHLHFGHLDDYRKRFNPDIIRIVDGLGAKMIAANAAFDVLKNMTDEERIANLQTFKTRVRKICRQALPALPAIDDAAFQAPNMDEVAADISAMQVGRTMDKSRVDRLLRLGLVSRRPEIGVAAFSLTDRGRRFLKDPRKVQL